MYCVVIHMCSCCLIKLFFFWTKHSHIFRFCFNFTDISDFALNCVFIRLHISGVYSVSFVPLVDVCVSLLVCLQLPSMSVSHLLHRQPEEALCYGACTCLPYFVQ
jgi:hypothetical protein